MTRCDTLFKKSVRLKCYEALVQKGFMRFAKEGVDKPVNENSNCWIGLNTGLYPDRVEINPFIGVHNISIAKLRVKLEGGKYDRGIATYAIPMGDIFPACDELAFTFTPQQNEESIISEAERLANLYANIGFVYAEYIASYDVLLPLLESRIEMLGGYPEKVACCLYLMGAVNRAQVFTIDFASREPDYFQSFADAFLRIIKADDGPHRT